MIPSSVFDPVVIAGAGSWGTALANALAAAGRRCVLWSRDPLQVEEMARVRENRRSLPDVALHPAVQVSASLDVFRDAGCVLLVVPAQATREICLRLQPVVGAGVPLVLCSKGIERQSGMFLSDVVSEVVAQGQVAVLSGPSFAEDVGRGLPTAVTLAAEDEAVAQALVSAFASTTLRLYHSSDIRGVEIGGAAKNVLAIACGIASGLALGSSAVAALTARGFAELIRFGQAYGARPETLTGLSGLGDLILTCGSARSRNFAYGLALGRGVPPRGVLAEGVFTASVLVDLAQRRGVDVPICQAVEAVVSGRLSVTDAADLLLSRPLRGEA